MLIDQHVAGLGTLLVHATNIRHHVTLEQVEQPANGVQQHGVMTGFGNRQVKPCIRSPLLHSAHLVGARIAILQRFKRCGQPFTVNLRGA